ncbi:MAG TPA: hydroxyphenylacetyl-CoA thioesterase PaaI [Rhodocyclaceae bacterium]|nr:MAG: phenylacetic acid degradation protein PaaD [Betaproteobacteria bacterium CG2_30_68_42]PIV71757.1 MAG: phenylacetic acid degradation protein PaaD [Rhodocyclales bacterium CG17_big_fil_post_rev_8_21_14_2_50_68_7]PIX74126.1 MAG: phenylacetic acid degradation protein PaaD [Rhodocyclales bacterium CG_4_10_14_3_um_filter_68_10]PJA57121.1 MAG: phenylacetic acid degradation protein PaaD [Rhodocyclales bacterium CG_4_9_14_3_um_filter_68_10]HCX32943.1 hydroxyphenylacetyl-CoA thioesterase PaaI [Rh
MTRNRDEAARRLAQSVLEAMFPLDRTAQFLGIEVVEIGPGRARARLAIGPHMTNGHGICHGGILFTLADTAFAYACNSHNRNAVAAGCAIDFIAPARVGDTLTATAVECSLAGRSGIYDVEVSDQEGRRIALFRGRSRSIAGEVVRVPQGAASVSNPPGQE